MQVPAGPRPKRAADRMGAYIEGRDVNLTFRPPSRAPVPALRHFDIDVNEGEFLSIVGPSGCGKSTFLNVLLGLIAPDSGALSVDGKSITGPGTDRAMVFQEFGLLPWRTVQANVELGLELKGMAAPERRDISQRLVRMVGLAGFETHYPHELSGGMKQRVGLARALATDPDVLLMDEPFAALDAQTRRVLQQELVKIWQATRKSVLFITHDIDEAIILGTRIGVMTAGPAARLKEVIVVDESVGHDRRHPSFMEFFKIIHALIEEEVNKTLLREQDTQSSSVGGTQA